MLKITSDGRSFSDLERSLGIATLPTSPTAYQLTPRFSDLERSLGIATAPRRSALLGDLRPTQRFRGL